MFLSLKFYIISSFINFAVNLFFGFFVLSKNRRKNINRICAYFCFSVSAWSFFYCAWLSATNGSLADLFVRTCILSATFIALTFLHFCFLLIKIEVHPTLGKIELILAICLGIIIYTPLFAGQAEHFLIFPYWPRAGFGFYLFTVYFTVNVLMGLIVLIRKYILSNDRITKSQIMIVLCGLIFAFLGGSINFLPWYRIPILPVTTLLTSLWALFSIYAIIQYRFMEIDTVIHRTFMWAVTASLLVVPFSMGIGLTVSWFLEITLFARVILLTMILYIFLSQYHYLKPRIDHVFRRRKYDYYKVLAELGQKVGSELELKKVGSRIFKELKNILYIRNGVLLVQQASGNYEKVTSLKTEIAGRLKETEEEVLRVDFNGAFSQYLNRNQRVLEREQIDVDPQYEGIKGEALAMMSQNEIEVLIPTVLEDKVNGMIGIGKKENLQTYTKKDVELLERMGRQLGITIDNALHHGDIVEKERLAEELRLGQEIQMNLLPKTTPEIDGLKLAGLMKPAKEIGGDYYDYIEQMADKSKKLGIVIGDVSGKGVGAGLIMATVKATLKGLSQQGLTPKGMLTQANSIIHEYTNGDKFMTMLYMEWDSEQKKMSYSSAGHEHIIIYRSGRVIGVRDEETASDKVVEIGSVEGEARRSHSAQGGISRGEVEVIQSGGFMLGIMPEIGDMLEDRTLLLSKGDKVILYTDGVTEARNPQDEMFSMARLTEAIKEDGHKPCAELINILKDSVYSFIGDAEQYDDVTLVVMEAV